MKRATGYCTNNECEDYAKGTFLLNHGGIFHCNCCKKAGLIMEEKGTSVGKSDNWKEVRVEFNYDLIQRKYRGLASVKDESLPGTHNVYTLQSPLIRTDRRALKVAESLLASLQDNPPADGNIEGVFSPRAVEKVINFDEPLENVKRNLDILSKGWNGLKV